MNFVYMNTHGRNVFCTHGQGLHGMLVLFNLHEHWNGNSIILMKFHHWLHGKLPRGAIGNKNFVK